MPLTMNLGGGTGDAIQDGHSFGDAVTRKVEATCDDGGGILPASSAHPRPMSGRKVTAPKIDRRPQDAGAKNKKEPPAQGGKLLEWCKPGLYFFLKSMVPSK